MPNLEEKLSIFAKRILSRLLNIKNKNFSDAVKNILKAFTDQALQTNSFFKKNQGEVNLEQKNKLITIFGDTKTSKISDELEHNIIKWVLDNTGGQPLSGQDFDNEWLFNDKKVIRSNLFTDVTRNKKRLKNYFTQLEALENDFEEIKDVDEEKYYQLVLAMLCLFILEKKDIFIKLAQEKAEQEKATQKKATQKKITLSDTYSKNTSNLSSPNSQKKGNKNLPPKARKSLPPVSSQETMEKKASNQFTNQKDHLLTTELPNSDQSSLSSIQPADLETSIEDNPINLDQHKKEKTKVVEFTLYFPDQKNKTADSCLNGQKNLDLQDITRYQFEIEPSLPYQDLKKISTELKNKRNRLKEKLLALAQFPSNKALLNLKESPLHLPVSAGLVTHTSIEDNRTQLDQNKEEKTKVVEVIIDFSQKEKIDDPNLAQMRKSTYEKTAKILSYSAIKKSTSYKDLEKEIEELKKEIQDLTLELQNSSHQNAQQETNIPIYEEALNNYTLENQLKNRKYSENIYSEISSNALSKDDIEKTSQQTNKNLLQEDQTKEINLPKDKSIQPENKKKLVAEKLSQEEKIINNQLDAERENENQSSQLENSILTLERKMAAEKDNAAYSTQSAQIKGEINQEDKADTEKFDTLSFEEDKLITENQTISHQSTAKEIAIKSSKVSVDQPETKIIDLQNIKEKGSQNLQKDNSVFPLEQATNNNSENINVNIEPQDTKKPSSLSFINEKNMISYIGELDEEICRITQEEKELETNRDKLKEYLKKLIYNSDINNEEINTSLIEETSKKIYDIDQHQEKLKNQLAELRNTKKYYQGLADILSFKKYCSLTANSIIDEYDNIDLNNSCDLSRNMGTNNHAESGRNNEEATDLDWDKGDIQFDSEKAVDPEWDMYMDTNSHSEPDGNVENQEQRTSKPSRSLTEDQENNYQQRNNLINQTIETHNLSSETEPTPLGENTAKEADDRAHQLTENKTTDTPIAFDSLDSQEPLLSERSQQFERQEKISSQPILTLDEDGEEQENDSQQKDRPIIESTPLAETIAVADDRAHQLTENKTTDAAITFDSLDSQEPLLSERNQQVEHQEKISSQPILTLNGDGEEQENDSQQRDNLINETVAKDNGSSEIKSTFLEENTSKEADGVTIQLTENKTDSPKTLESSDSQESLPSENNSQFEKQEQRTSERSLVLTEEPENNSQQINNITNQSEEKDKDNKQLVEKIRIAKEEQEKHQQQQTLVTALEDQLEKTKNESNQQITEREHPLQKYESVQTEPLTNEEIGRKIGSIQAQSTINKLSINDNEELENNREGIKTMGLARYNSSKSIGSGSDTTYSGSELDAEESREGNTPIIDPASSNSSEPIGSGSDTTYSGSELATEKSREGNNPIMNPTSSTNDLPEPVASPPNLSGQTPTEKEDFIELKKGRKINVPLFNFNDWESFSSFASIIASQINKNNCDDIVELDKFKPSDDFNKTLLSNPELKVIIDGEKERLEKELKTELLKFWQGCAQCQTNDALKQVESNFNEQIKKIKPKKLKDLWDEIPTNQEEIAKEYSNYIDSAMASAKKKTLKAGDSQTSPLLNQLKVKILRAGFKSPEQAKQAFEQGMFIEKGKKEKKETKEVSLKQGEIDPSKQIKDFLLLRQSKVEDLMLDSIEKRLPLYFEEVVSCSEEDKANIGSMTSTSITHNAAVLLPWILLFTFISLLINSFREKENEKVFTNACTSLIKNKHLMIDPDEIKYGLKQKEKGNDDYKVIKPLSALKVENQLQIHKANTKQSELIKDELIENSKPTHCFVIAP